MNQRRRFVALILAASVVSPFTSFAQSKSPQAQNARPPLENLDDNRLMDELASRGMTGLLDHYFKKNNIPAERQREIRVVIALRNLDSESFARKSAVERKKEIQEVVEGINQILPTIKDPQRLMRYASGLILNGTSRLITLLELWGENPRTQAALNPIAETVDKILAQAVNEADTKANTLLALIKTANDPRQPQWEEASNFANLAKWTRANAAYGLALSYDRASPQRVKVCKDNIEVLKQFNDEGSTVRVAAELMIAKLSMAMGGDEGFKQAKEYFDKVIKAQSDDEKNPKQYVLEQYQARYFTLVSDVLAKKPEEAQKGLADLKAWQDTNMPTDPQTRLSMGSAQTMLEYRIDAALAEQAKDPAQKEKLSAEAVAVLMDLLAKRPELRGIVFEQVIARLPDKPDLSKLDPLLLEAIVARGINITQRTGAAEKDDSRNIQLAADAAREIVKRKGQAGISVSQVDNAAFSIGVFEERIGSAGSTDLTPAQRDVNKQDAAEAYLNYIQNFGGNANWAESALDHALRLVAELHKANANDDRNNALYDKALDLGYHKAGRKDLAYAFASRKKDVKDFPAAAKAYAAVQSDQPLVNVLAKYWQMFSDQQMLHKADPTQTSILSAEIQKLADELNPMLSSAIAAAPDAKAKASLQLVRVRSILIAADVARANKNAARVVQLLEGFEGQLSGLTPADQDELSGTALFLRVNALIALNRNDEAIKAVQDLIRQNPQKALTTVTLLLTKLNESFNVERGKEHPDDAALAILAGQRAQLSALLVEQVQKDPSLPAKNRREYLTFNAHSQVEASKLQKDPAKRSAYLTEALKTYQEMLKGVPESDSEFANLQRLIAMAEFEIGDPENVQKAHDTLNELFAAKKFGTPMIRIGDEARSNDLFWEGLLRLLQAKVKLAAAKSDPSLKADATRILKDFVIQFGDQTGGDAYAKDFRNLRKELLGDWKPVEATSSLK
jgi:hypothetical protein